MGYLVAVFKDYLGEVSKVPILQAQGTVFKSLESKAVDVCDRQVP